MKRLLVGLLLLLPLATASAEIVGLQFAPEEIPEDTYVIKYSSSTMDMLEVEPLASQTYDYAFRSKDGRFEIRYILFRQTGEIPSFEEFRLQASLWSTMVIANITGHEPTTANTSAFNNDDVRTEFNADFGITSFSNNITTDYSDDFECVMMSFYCKQGLGIVCQTIHFNDLAWAQTEEFVYWFHGFYFL